MKFLILMVGLQVLSPCSFSFGQQSVSPKDYVFGPDDAISVNVVGLPELDGKSLGAIRIDPRGTIHLPLVGRLKAANLTAPELEKEIAGHLSSFMNNPEVEVAVVGYRDHPVSVLGAVRNPGVYQVTSPKTIFQILSMAGGLNPDASNRVKISRPISSGALPLPNASLDKNREFSVAELNVRMAMEGKTPEENIRVLPNDVITVPKADLVYVVGAVHRSGSFPLSEKEQISILQAVSLAEGLDKVANAKNARILRQTTPGGERTEVVVNVDKIMDGKAEDIGLQANDILFIPNSLAKSASMRALEAAIQAGTGMVIWGR